MTCGSDRYILCNKVQFNMIGIKGACNVVMGSFKVTYIVKIAPNFYGKLLSFKSAWTPLRATKQTRNYVHLQVVHSNNVSSSRSLDIINSFLTFLNSRFNDTHERWSKWKIIGKD